MTLIQQLVEASTQVAEMARETCTACSTGKLVDWNGEPSHGCCKSCGWGEGYLHGRYNNKKDIDFLKKTYGFNKKNGFLGKTGCNLPREHRSYVCLHFLCDRPRKNIPAVEGPQAAVSDIMQDIWSLPRDKRVWEKQL